MVAQIPRLSRIKEADRLRISAERVWWTLKRLNRKAAGGFPSLPTPMLSTAAVPLGLMSNAGYASRECPVLRATWPLLCHTAAYTRGGGSQHQSQGFFGRTLPVPQHSAYASHELNRTSSHQTLPAFHAYSCASPCARRFLKYSSTCG